MIRVYTFAAYVLGMLFGASIALAAMKDPGFAFLAAFSALFGTMLVLQEATETPASAGEDE